MKQFIGKILNLFGIISLLGTNIFAVVFFIIGCVMGSTVIGDFSQYVANPWSLCHTLQFLVFFVGVILSILVIIYLLSCLIHNSVGRFSFLLSLLLLIYEVFNLLFFLYIKINLQSDSTIGLNIYFISWVGGLFVLSALSIFIGNLLNIHQSGKL